MSKIDKVYCMFEQSGTFKEAFKKIGINAIDIDIENRFNKTDIQINIFNEIDKYYKNENNIFNCINNNDLIIAFFPCIRFEVQSNLLYNGGVAKSHKYNTNKAIDLAIKSKEEQNKHYMYFAKFYKICLEKNIKAIIENPYQTSHYLIRYFPVKPTIIDYDRRKNGDNYKKPTMYYFINFNPSINIQNYTILQPDIFTINEMPKGIIRSIINNDYATNFIKKYILEEE